MLSLPEKVNSADVLLVGLLGTGGQMVVFGGVLSWRS